MGIPQLLWAYIITETTLPLTSVLAAIIGLLLIFWRYTLGLGKRAFQTFLGKSTQPSGARGQESGVSNPKDQPPTPNP